MMLMSEDAMAGPYEDVIVHPAATDVDYEVRI